MMQRPLWVFHFLSTGKTASFRGEQESGDAGRGWRTPALSRCRLCCRTSRTPGPCPCSYPPPPGPPIPPDAPANGRCVLSRLLRTTLLSLSRLAPSPPPAPSPGYPAPLSLLFCSSVFLTAEVRLSAWALSTGLFLLALRHRVLLVLPMWPAPLFSSSPTPISPKPTSAQP